MVKNVELEIVFTQPITCFLSIVAVALLHESTVVASWIAHLFLALDAIL